MTSALFELWTSLLSCGHWTKPIGYGGHPYGRSEPGHWISCRRCQCQRKVIETRCRGTSSPGSAPQISAWEADQRTQP